MKRLLLAFLLSSPLTGAEDDKLTVYNEIQKIVMRKENKDSSLEKEELFKEFEKKPSDEWLTAELFSKEDIKRMNDFRTKEKSTRKTLSESGSHGLRDKIKDGSYFGIKRQRDISTQTENQSTYSMLKASSVKEYYLVLQTKERMKDFFGKDCDLPKKDMISIYKKYLEFTSDMIGKGEKDIYIHHYDSKKIHIDPEKDLGFFESLLVLLEHYDHVLLDII